MSSPYDHPKNDPGFQKIHNIFRRLSKDRKTIPFEGVLSYKGHSPGWSKYLFEVEDGRLSRNSCLGLPGYDKGETFVFRFESYDYIGIKHKKYGYSIFFFTDAYTLIEITQSGEEKEFIKME